jgi:hypothetical protein
MNARPKAMSQVCLGHRRCYRDIAAGAGTTGARAVELAAITVAGTKTTSR